VSSLLESWTHGTEERAKSKQIASNNMQAPQAVGRPADRLANPKETHTLDLPPIPGPPLAPGTRTGRKASGRRDVERHRHVVKRIGRADSISTVPKKWDRGPEKPDRRAYQRATRIASSKHDSPSQRYGATLESPITSRIPISRRELRVDPEPKL
jgi:hypothetical protein